MAVFKLSQAVATVLVSFLAIVGSAKAADFSFRGTFASDDAVQFFGFTVSQNSTVTLKSLSYAGGTQADGTVVSAGGFDPILSLFDSTGSRVGQNDDGSSPNVTADPATGLTYDTFFQSAVTPGNYTVAVSQYNNFAGANSTDPFPNTGQPNFTASYGCRAGQFCDLGGNSRTNHWAFDILNVDQADAPPPEPVSFTSL
jgi:hypothetical protein